MNAIDLDGYRILEKVGEGGQGEVFKAVQLSLNRKVAIKALRLSTDSSKDSELLRKEAVLLASLSNPNICTVYDLIQKGQRTYIIEEYLEGLSLREILQNGISIPFERIIESFRDVLQAVQYLHGKGVIHLDLKPENSLFDEESKPRITDFGIARQISHDTFRSSDGILGTLQYMAPEIIDQPNSAGPASDIYSLGCTLYEALMRKPPYPLADGMGITKYLAKKMQELPDNSDLTELYPSRVVEILNKMMQPNPKERYNSIADVLVDFCQIKVLDDSEQSRTYQQTTLRILRNKYKAEQASMIQQPSLSIGSQKAEVQADASLSSVHNQGHKTGLVPITAVEVRKAFSLRSMKYFALIVILLIGIVLAFILSIDVIASSGSDGAATVLGLGSVLLIEAILIALLFRILMQFHFVREKELYQRTILSVLYSARSEIGLVDLIFSCNLDEKVLRRTLESLALEGRIIKNTLPMTISYSINESWSGIEGRSGAAITMTLESAGVIRIPILVLLLIQCLTPGLFRPLWFILQRRGLNRLGSSQKITVGIIVFYVAFHVIGLLCEAVLAGVSNESGPPIWTACFIAIPIVVRVISITICQQTTRILGDRFPNLQNNFSWSLAFILPSVYMQNIINRIFLSGRDAKERQ